MDSAASWHEARMRLALPQRPGILLSEISSESSLIITSVPDDFRAIEPREVGRANLELTDYK
jgi:hypothetical protein